MEMIRMSNDKYNCSEETKSNISIDDEQRQCYKNRRERRATTRKKQVRRRIHRSKPYQERLLNMAEARKEIVAALKYHRSSMRKRQEKEETDRISSNAPDLSFLDLTAPEVQEPPKYMGAERRALDEEEMEEIRSIGKKQQMEWDDTFNLLTYASWFTFLHSFS